ncbi:hypothetical protein CDD82_176 [Ophiocordyceps australis]|uniref:Histone-lysine N-methyltransferase SET9 n=1 Tax=Ophiocordyceps australis TaxID=1399860 RepID=A0A2C5YUA4_9HYPO|nr:hypothetical protein CDD82_176 [Ophiocordyceps australis]
MSTRKDTPTSKKQRLTLAQLAAYDDIVTDALVDHVFYWTTVPKNRSSYHPSRGIRDTVIADVIQRHVIVDRDVDAGQEKLLATDGLKRFLASLKTDKEREDFVRHMRRYLQIYLPDCPWEVNTTNRYTIVSHEASVTARRPIRRNETIKYLSGIQVNMTADEEKEIAVRKKDFSIVVSSRNKCTSLFMGPARFANHDCDANAKLVTTGQAGIEIIATRPIDVGDEITVTYGDSYFGQDNCECLCYTCERNLCNGWMPQGDAAVCIKPSVECLDDEARAESYLLRRRRQHRDDSTGDGSSRTPSVTPGIRPRISKTKRKSSMLGNGRGPSQSAAPSPAPHGTPRGRKRPVDAMATPPITPAKRLKHVDADCPAKSMLSRGSSSHSREPSPGSGDAMETDITSPEKETPEPKIKTEGDVVATQSTSDASSSSCPPSEVGLQSPPQSRDMAASVSYESMSVGKEAVSVSSIAVSIENEEGSHGCGEAQEKTRQRKKYTRRVFIKQTTPPARLRTPGDYVLTPLLLSEPETAWIQCTNCSTYFVQQNAYFTKCSCPRCERHSKLYGYLWPKTDKAGPSDKEVRVLDHRTVHRFLDSHDERRARGRKGFLENDEAGEEEEEEEAAAAAAAAAATTTATAAAAATAVEAKAEAKAEAKETATADKAKRGGNKGQQGAKSKRKKGPRADKQKQSKSKDEAAVRRTGRLRRASERLRG